MPTPRLRRAAEQCITPHVDTSYFRPPDPRSWRPTFSAAKTRTFENRTHLIHLQAEGTAEPLRRGALAHPLRRQCAAPTHVAQNAHGCQLFSSRALLSCLRLTKDSEHGFLPVRSKRPRTRFSSGVPKPKLLHKRGTASLSTRTIQQGKGKGEAQATCLLRLHAPFRTPKLPPHKPAPLQVQHARRAAIKRFSLSTSLYKPAARMV